MPSSDPEIGVLDLVGIDPGLTMAVERDAAVADDDAVLALVDGFVDRNVWIDRLVTVERPLGDVVLQFFDLVGFRTWVFLRLQPHHRRGSLHTWFRPVSTVRK